ncbi:hypothetical protein Hanom_Chr05g00421841 [Helianthus anomalus]
MERIIICSYYSRRFAVGTYSMYTEKDFKKNLHVRTQFLLPGITYTVNLVFKFSREGKRRSEPIFLKYRLQGERESSISYLAYDREDGWWACELYQFTCDYRIVHFRILFEGYDNGDSLKVEGKKFQPLENVERIDEK